MNYNYLTTIFRSILTHIYVYLVLFTIFHFDVGKVISKNCKYIFFYQKFVHLCENTSKYCSQIIVVHVHATAFTCTYVILPRLSREHSTLVVLELTRHCRQVTSLIAYFKVTSSYHVAFQRIQQLLRAFFKLKIVASNSEQEKNPFFV